MTINGFFYTKSWKFKNMHFPLIISYSFVLTNIVFSKLPVSFHLVWICLGFSMMLSGEYLFKLLLFNVHIQITVQIQGSFSWILLSLVVKFMDNKWILWIIRSRWLLRKHNQLFVNTWIHIDTVYSTSQKINIFTINHATSLWK